MGLVQRLQARRDQRRAAGVSLGGQRQRVQGRRIRRPADERAAAVPPQHTIRLDCAFYNKANGLYANHGIVSPFFYDNTSFNNGTDVDMLGLDGTTVTSVGVLRNNLAYSNNGHGLLADMTHGGPLSEEFNSWDTACT